MVAWTNNDRPVRGHSLQLTHEPVILHPVEILQIVSDVPCNHQSRNSVFVFPWESQLFFSP